MNSQEIPAPVLDLFEGLEDSPNEAVQRFAGVTRWVRRRRAERTPERIGRELGSVVSEEVARVLGQHANRDLCDDHECEGLYHRIVRVGERLELPSSHDLQSEARALSLNGLQSDRSDESTRALRQVYRGLRPRRLDTLLLAWRLCPLANIAHLLAIEYRLHRQWKASSRLLAQVLDGHHGSLHRSYALENLAGLALAQNDAETASRCFRDASECGEDRPSALMGWFFVSLTLGDLPSTSLAGARAEEMIADDDRAVSACIEFIRALRRRKEFDARAHTSIAHRDIAQGDGTTSIFHELL